LLSLCVKTLYVGLKLPGNNINNMASTIGKLLFALALFFFFLAFIFVIVAYSTFWLVPRDNYTQDTDRVDGVGLKRACFTEFIFPLGLDPSNFEINGCYDNTRDSPTFARIKNIDVWSPRKKIYKYLKE